MYRPKYAGVVRDVKLVTWPFLARVSGRQKLMCGLLSATSGRVYRDKDPKPEKKSGAGGNRKDPKSFRQKLSQHAVTVLLRLLPSPELNVGVTNRFVGLSLPHVGESLCHKWASLLGAVPN